jgi:4-amino-4-deoxy-L-arabinose transferase-like glycosyltransferase
MSEAPARSLERKRFPRIFSWIAFSTIIVAYVFFAVRLHPTNFFGFSHDDALYFSSAKAIAEGHDYILPSVPGTPPATKYPILYPWVLSWVWRLNPSFPANISSAVALNLVFGAMYLLAAFTFLRRLPGFSDAVALLLTAVCALHPKVLFLSANLMADIPFAALALGACVVAARVNEKEAKSSATVWCGILTGLSILVRAMGIPIAAGLFLAICLRSGWRKASVFAACVVPFIGALLWRSMLSTPQMPPVAANSCAQSWRTVWLYYTSYAGFWKADVLSHGVFWQTVASNLRSVVLQPGMYFVKLTFIRPTVLALVLLLALSAVAIRGVFRLAESAGWQPIHFALGFSILPIMIWDYSVMDRFLIPFFPLLCAAICIEVRQIVLQIRNSPARKGNGVERKLAAVFLSAAGAVLLWGVEVSWRGEIGSIKKIGESRGALLEEKRAAYAWLEKKTASNSRILAYEDASAFLYSGRQGLRPVIFSAAGVYRPDVLSSELACIVSSARPVGANYWVVSDDDFASEWEPASSRALEKEREMERTLGAIFRSEHGGVRIYKLDAEEEPAL